jgi:hypothetical protein
VVAFTERIEKRFFTSFAECHLYSTCTNSVDNPEKLPNANITSKCHRWTPESNSHPMNSTAVILWDGIMENISVAIWVIFSVKIPYRTDSLKMRIVGEVQWSAKVYYKFMC